MSDYKAYQKLCRRFQVIGASHDTIEEGNQKLFRAISEELDTQAKRNRLFEEWLEELRVKIEKLEKISHYHYQGEELNDHTR